MILTLEKLPDRKTEHFKKMGIAVQPASQNPYPIYDQNLPRRFSLPYLWPDHKFDTLFMTWLLGHCPVSDLRSRR